MRRTLWSSLTLVALLATSGVQVAAAQPTAPTQAAPAAQITGASGSQAREQPGPAGAPLPPATAGNAEQPARAALPPVVPVEQLGLPAPSPPDLGAAGAVLWDPADDRVLVGEDAETGRPIA